MKRCPQCYQPYADSERFCESDGQPLLNDISVTSPVGQVVDTQPAVLDASAQKREMRMMVIVGVMVGMVITSLGYAGYSIVSAFYPAAEETNLPVSRVETVDTRQPAPTTRSAIVEPSPSPEEEASPSPEAEDAEVEDAAKAETREAQLNQGPVSTGERRQHKEEHSGKTIIEMTDGTRVEVDAAWKDNQGVWYRRGGLVSFVESSRIKTIQARQESKADPLSSPTP
jgi:hypothetical protein